MSKDQYADEIEVPLKLLGDPALTKENIYWYGMVSNRCEQRGWCRDAWIEVWGEPAEENIQILVQAGYLWHEDNQLGLQVIWADLPDNYLDSREYQWMDEDNRGPWAGTWREELIPAERRDQ